MYLVLAAALGGAIGASVRHLLSLALNSDLFNQGIVIANVVGCMGIGYLAGLPWLQQNLWIKTLLITGFLGGLTTFSSLIHESVQLQRHQPTTFALLYPITSFALGWGAYLLGQWLQTRV